MNFLFNNKYCKAFRNLKDRLIKVLILTLFNPEKEAVLKADVLDRAIGAALT